ncbi:cartilage matrix protein-like [Haliotis rubra]|uniref:cartilage matrix protein-like n=1 Tax=Haliotis rubra TaxID=36100 RepID=UPI001EE5A808|nr:cartilage matrix protein-like [Haliotis rubra]
MFILSVSTCLATDPCLSSPCINGRTCEKASGTNGFRCRCKVGFQGLSCEKECEQKSLDILLIEDVSTSIGEENYKKIKDFEVELVSASHIVSETVNVALMTFAGKAKLVFPLKSYRDNKTAAVQAVSVPQNEGGSTFLGDAINMAVSDVFVESNGDRPDAENVVILFTDGQSGKSSVISKNIESLHAEATVFVVLMTAGVNNATISMVPSPPYKDHVFLLSNPLALDKIKEKTIYERCGLTMI